MSLNKSLYLKLQLGQDLRKVPKLPANLSDLHQIISSFFGTTEFRIRYIDEERDLVTISTDADLQFAYQTAIGLSLKIVLTPKDGVAMSQIDLMSMSTISDTRSKTDSPALDRKPEIKPTTDRPQEEPAKSDRAGLRNSMPSVKSETMPSFPWMDFFGKFKKRLFRGCGRKGRREAFLLQMVRQEVSSILGVQAPVIHPGVQCDGCNQVPLIGARYKCTVCPNFDFCELCEAQATHPHPFLKISDPAVPLPEVKCVLTPVDREAAVKSYAKIGQDKKPKMDFILHTSYHEGETVQAGATLDKVWAVRNPGSLPWPLGTTIQMVKGNLSAEKQEVLAVLPGREGFISAKIRVPQKEGNYSAVFRLFMPDGRRFGEKLHVAVKAEEPEMPMKETPLEEAKPYKYQMEILQTMGFEDTPMLENLLMVYYGDVEKVITALLTQ